jgi:hypothetical protein
MDQHMASTEKQMLGTETVRALRAKGFKNTICGLSAMIEHPAPEQIVSIETHSL